MKTIALVLLLVVPIFFVVAQNEDSLRRTITRLSNQLMKESDDNSKAQTYKFLGQTYHKLLGYNKYSIENYHKSMDLFSKTADSTHYYEMAFIIGNYYLIDASMRQYGVSYLKKALQYYRKINNQIQANQCVLGLVSHRIATDSLDGNMLSDLKTVINEPEKNLSKNSRAYANNIIANYFLKKQEIDSAYVYAQESLKWSQNEPIIEALNYFYSGIYFHFKKAQYKEAINQFNTALPLAQKEMDYTFVQSIYRHLGATYDSLGNYKKAYFYRNEQLKLLEAVLKYQSSLLSIS